MGEERRTKGKEEVRWRQCAFCFELMTLSLDTLPKPRRKFDTAKN
jgi:hypothetical protein